MAPQRKDTNQGSLAAEASEQLRTIIEAAEQTAAQIRSKAEREAERIRREAEEEASALRGQARGDARLLLDRIHDGLSRVSADLERLTEMLQPAPEPAPPPKRAPARPEPAAVEPAPAEPAMDEPAGDKSADLESARLIALNMALDGTPRDDVDRYLDENFELDDRDALLDDIYASIG